MTKFALFGAGLIGSVHANNIAAHPRATLRYVYDVNTAAAEQAASRFGAQVASSPEEVWASDDAPGDLASRLGAAGVQVARTETMTGYLEQLGRRAPALGLWLYLLAGAAAIGLAVGFVLHCNQSDEDGVRVARQAAAFEFGNWSGGRDTI